jgi:chromosome segregation ATPase
VSSSSSASSTSVESFASAEQFTIAPEGLPIDNSIPTPSTMSQTDISIAPDDSPHGRKLQEIEDRKKQLQEKLTLTQEKQAKDLVLESDKTAKEIEKAAEKHERDRKKQEDKFEKEIRKLEERREKETKKLLLRQQKEADKNQLLKAQRERDEHKQRADISEQENKLLKEQVLELQRENTALVARLGKTDVGRDILRTVREEDMTGRKRTNSRSSGKNSRTRGESDVSSVSIARSSTEKMR